MKAIGDTITIKTLQELLDEHLIQKVTDTNYISVDAKIPWQLVGNEPYLGNTFEITDVDEDNESVPYMVQNCFWIPLFMIKESSENSLSDDRTVETENPKKGKDSIFSKLIKQEKEIFNTTLIKDSNFRRMSICTEEVLNRIENILKHLEPNYTTYQSAVNGGLRTDVTRSFYIYKYCVTIL